jgi:hypothetical protein
MVTVTVTVTGNVLNTKALTLVSRLLSQPVQSPNDWMNRESSVSVSTSFAIGKPSQSVLDLNIWYMYRAICTAGRVIVRHIHVHMHVFIV